MSENVLEGGFGLKFVDHVAISVPMGQLDSQVSLYEKLGFKVLHREEVPAPHLVREVLLQVGDSENLIQLLEPLSAESPVAKQIEKNGGRGGLAHVAFRTDDIAATYAAMKAAGFQTTQEPGPGSRGTTVFFVHPKSHAEGSFGVLYEVVQESSENH
ncbi:MAG: VOC family protein [Fimbriimonadaceae bacterium]